MARHNAANERIKREYLHYLKEAKGRDEATLDGVAKSLARFEESTGWKAFKRFHREEAVVFKKRLADALSIRTGERLAKATVQSTMRDLKAFFFWLAHQPGYKSVITYGDADYFNLSERDAAIARGMREKAVPSLEQVHHVLAAMPANTVLERRDRALIAFTALTAARVGALATFQLQHVNVVEGYVEQDARVVATKFGKTFRTYFMTAVGDALAIFEAWVAELRHEHLWAPTDPLFPATRMGLNAAGVFSPLGLERRAWATTQPIRDIFRRAFTAAGLPYFNPHSFRDMLVHHAMKLNQTPELMKAWSQNLGHDDVLTTFTSYGQVPMHRQGELIRQQGRGLDSPPLDDPDIMELIKRIQSKR